MDRYQAYQDFWSGFGVPAFDETTVPNGENAPTLPYITYGFQEGGFDRSVSVGASVWSRSTSWSEALIIWRAIKRRIGQGICVPFENGVIFLRFGSPLMTRMGDPSDDMIRRININVEAEFISAEI